MSSRSYLSIGDVLTLLRQEFPDVTISKIRFLESQGLVNPERTPSGYRKFYEHDVERLRWVLRQQREHFLPLKVIKDRLDEDVSGAAPVPEAVDGAAVDAEIHPVKAPASVAAATVGAPSAQLTEEISVLVGSGIPTDEVNRESSSAHLRTPARATVGTPATSGAASNAVAPVTASSAAAVPVEHAHRASMAAQSVPSTTRSGDARAANGTAKRTTVSGPADHAAPSEPSAPKPAAGTPRKAAPPTAAPAISADARTVAGAGTGGSPAGSSGGTTVAGSGGASLSLEELCSASGLTGEEIALLQEYSLLSSTVAAGVEFFDEEALAVANLSARFATFGIEARHLRLYKNAADREAGFIEQIVIPMVRQRNPEARARATLTAEDLASLGEQLKASLLRTALRNIL